mmetsp:Transcript_3419/g.9883  ORF Transcript_3419/g.9883 Transcript_3419/m.9883 type:complete len:221 (+) Transcript_3419:746-1408(+)
MCGAPGRREAARGGQPGTTAGPHHPGGAGPTGLAEGATSHAGHHDRSGPVRGAHRHGPHRQRHCASWGAREAHQARRGGEATGKDHAHHEALRHRAERAAGGGGGRHRVPGWYPRCGDRRHHLRPHRGAGPPPGRHRASHPQYDFFAKRLAAGRAGGQPADGQQDRGPPAGGGGDQRVAAGAAGARGWRGLRGAGARGAAAGPAHGEHEEGRLRVRCLTS